jgi:hypothetical protein
LNLKAPEPQEQMTLTETAEKAGAAATVGMAEMAMPHRLPIADTAGAEAMEPPAGTQLPLEAAGAEAMAEKEVMQ